MNSWRWLVVLGLAVAPFVACGPDHRPEQPCDGPSFNLVVRAENGPLPPDTRINVRYGGNPDGEAYELGTQRKPQAVSCVEDTTAAGAGPVDAPAAAGEAGASGDGGLDVWRLRCGLYTQGPAHLDVAATGYEPIVDEDLSLTGKRYCELEETFVLVPLRPDAGK